MTESTALIALEAFGRQPREVLKRTLKQLNSIWRLEQVSSLYSIRAGEDQTAREEGFCICARGQFPGSFRQLSRQLENWVEGVKAPYRLLTYLLAVDGTTFMSKEVTLPYPDWHIRPDLLIPAAEIWADYEHPVLRRSLKELAQTVEIRDWGGFADQGKALLDF